MPNEFSTFAGMKIALLDDVHDLFRSVFEEQGWKVDLFSDSSRSALKETISEYNGIVLRSRIKMDEDLLQHAKSLKFIGRPGAGLENIDVDYCKVRGIKVYRSPEGNRDALAEHALGMLLMLFNNLKRADSEVRGGLWQREENRGHELMGKTVGIIGYGYMGKAFAQRLSGFGVKLLAYDKYKSDFGNNSVSEVSLEELKMKSDVISLHVPLTEETRGMINADFLSGLSRSVYLLNTARGPVVNTADLIDALQSGKVKGACLDVLEQESTSFEKVDHLPDSMQELLASDKVILSPHIAGWTHEAKQKMAEFLVEKILTDFGS